MSNIGNYRSKVVVEDVLDSISTDSALSANKGRELKELIEVNVGNIAVPVLLSPSDNSIGVLIEPTLKSSIYTSSNGSEQTGMNIEIYEDGDLTTPVHSTFVSGAVTSYIVPTGVLSYTQKYYWRVRYKDADGASSWSLMNSFTVSNSVQINKPINVSPSIGTQDVGDKVQLVSSTFAVTGGTDEHIQSQWQIFSDPLDLTSPPMYDSSWVTELESITMKTGVVAPDENYHWRVRHYGKYYGWSQWSDTTSFATSDSFGVLPIIVMQAMDSNFSPSEYKLRGISCNLDETYSYDIMAPLSPAYDGFVNEPMLSKDGSYLCICIDDVTGGCFRIYKRKGMGFHEVTVNNKQLHADAFSCDFSPNGRYLAIQFYYTSIIDIYEKQSDGSFSFLFQLFSGAGNSRSNKGFVRWSPCGEYLASTNPIGYQLKVWKVGEYGGVLQFTDISGDIVFRNTQYQPITSSTMLHWSPDSSYIAYAVNGSYSIRIFHRTGDVFSENPSIGSPTQYYSLSWLQGSKYLIGGVRDYRHQYRTWERTDNTFIPVDIGLDVDFGAYSYGDIRPFDPITSEFVVFSVTEASDITENNRVFIMKWNPTETKYEYYAGIDIGDTTNVIYRISLAN
jgi:hypothetical protein